MELFTVLIDQRNVDAILQRIIRNQDVPTLNKGSLDLEILQSAKSIDDVLSYLQTTQYEEFIAIAKKQYELYGLTSHIDVAFDKYLRKRITHYTIFKPFGACSIFAYILRARIDKQNIQVITKGITANMPKDKLIEVLV